MLILEAQQSNLDTQRLAVIWMRDNKESSVMIIDPAHVTCFSLDGNKLSIDSQI